MTAHFIPMCEKWCASHFIQLKERGKVTPQKAKPVCAWTRKPASMKTTPATKPKELST